MSQKNKHGFCILYEVYHKRALHEPIETLVLLDRDTNNIKAERSAIQWGGVVVKVEANILSRRPIVREILKYEIYFIHKPNRAKERGERMTVPKIKSQLHKKHFKVWKKFKKP